MSNAGSLPLGVFLDMSTIMIWYDFVKFIIHIKFCWRNLKNKIELEEIKIRGTKLEWIKGI